MHPWAFYVVGGQREANPCGFPSRKEGTKETVYCRREVERATRVPLRDSDKGHDTVADHVTVLEVQGDPQQLTEQCIYVLPWYSRVR